MNAAQQAAALRVTNHMQASTCRTLSFTIEHIGKGVMVFATNCFSSSAFESLYYAQAFIGPRGGISHAKTETYS